MEMQSLKSERHSRSRAFQRLAHQVHVVSPDKLPIRGYTSLSTNSLLYWHNKRKLAQQAKTLTQGGILGRRKSSRGKRKICLVHEGFKDDELKLHEGRHETLDRSCLILSLGHRNIPHLREILDCCVG